MTKVWVTLGVVGGLIVLALGVMIGARNDFIRQEAGIKAQYTQNQNNYDNYWKKLKESAQVPDMYTDDMRKVYDAAMSGRYGGDGSKAVMQWIKEQNPQVDASIYRQIQQTIEAGRASFEADQKALIDKKRVYEAGLEVFPSNLVASALGFPRVDLDSFGIVTSAETKQAFETGESEPVKLR